jgi:hypothetical protein
MVYANFVTLPDIVALEPMAARLGVSVVARRSTGFLGAYKRAGGNPAKLPEAWAVKRRNFIRRHVAGARANNEPWFRDGEPTRRHLALIMWAYTPTPRRLAAGQNPSY